MIEVMLAGGFLLLLCAISAVLALVAWDSLLIGGSLLIVLGMAVGVPAGLVYHVKLYQCLGPDGGLPQGWWLGPTSLHHLLDDGPRGRQVMRWCYLGAAGFFVVIAGCVLLFAGAVRGR
jgi:hypothetical protein